MPVVGRLELADHPLGRAGERALLVAEQFAFEQRFGERGAVEADERAVAPRAGLVDRPGDQFLADAALAANEHRRLRLAHAHDLRLDLLSAVALADEFALEPELIAAGCGSRPRASTCWRSRCHTVPSCRATASVNSRSSAFSGAVARRAVQVQEAEHLVLEQDRAQIRLATFSSAMLSRFFSMRSAATFSASTACLRRQHLAG